VRSLQGTLVAVKLLLAVDEEGQQRFRREVQVGRPPTHYTYPTPAIDRLSTAALRPILC
jgi:hypothetical protein